MPPNEFRLLGNAPLSNAPFAPRFLITHLALPAGAALIISSLLMDGGGDFWVADHLYRLQGSRWALRDAWLTNNLLHRGSSYFTLASGGYIIRIKPIAIGMLVDPIERLFNALGTPSNNAPRPTPSAMAAKIQSVRYRSRKDRREVSVVMGVSGRTVS